MALELRNGADVVDYVEYHSQSVDAGDFLGLVLAHNGREYVTWSYNREYDGPAECFHGHYLNDDDVEARKEFVTRVLEFQAQYPNYQRHDEDEDYTASRYGLVNRTCRRYHLRRR